MEKRAISYYLMVTFYFQSMFYIPVIIPFERLALMVILIGEYLQVL